MVQMTQQEEDMRVPIVPIIHKIEICMIHQGTIEEAVESDQRTKRTHRRWHGKQIRAQTRLLLDRGADLPACPRRIASQIYAAILQRSHSSEPYGHDGKWRHSQQQERIPTTNGDSGGNEASRPSICHETPANDGRNTRLQDQTCARHVRALCMVDNSEQWERQGT